MMALNAPTPWKVSSRPIARIATTSVNVTLIVTIAAPAKNSQNWVDVVPGVRRQATRSMATTMKSVGIICAIAAKASGVIAHWSQNTRGSLSAIECASVSHVRGLS